jgi:hypothetical protein
MDRAAVWTAQFIYRNLNFTPVITVPTNAH